MEQFINLTIPWNVNPEKLKKVFCLICGAEGHKIGDVVINQIELGIHRCLDDDLMWLSPRPDASFYDQLYNKYFYSSTCPEQYGYANIHEEERRQEKARLNWNDIEQESPFPLKKENFLEIGSATPLFALIFALSHVRPPLMVDDWN